MLILTQSEEKIINTDTTLALRFTDDDKCIMATISVDSNTRESTNIILGEYFYKDRCKEILTDMMKKADVGARVYYMPKE